MEPFSLPTSPQFDTQIFNANSAGNTTNVGFQTWTKPSGKSMAHILCIGSGGRGGTGVIGANSTAAGGGGGGGGGMTVVEIPLYLIPDRLYISVGMGIATTTPTYVSVINNSEQRSVLCLANGGAVGGNASGATAGAAGAAGLIAQNSTMSLGWSFSKLAIAGQVGIIGGTTVSGASTTYPQTGIRTMGGTGGGGLPAAGIAGTAGGAITAIASPSYFQGKIGGIGGAAGTTPPTNGQTGTILRDAGFFSDSGTGGGSTHGTATGAGLVQAAGCNGAIGSGGGGMGGALTGSTAAAQSYGGPGLCVIVCY